MEKLNWSAIVFFTFAALVIIGAIRKFKINPADEFASIFADTLDGQFVYKGWLRHTIAFSLLAIVIVILIGHIWLDAWNGVSFGMQLIIHLFAGTFAGYSLEVLQAITRRESQSKEAIFESNKDALVSWIAYFLVAVICSVFVQFIFN